MQPEPQLILDRDNGKKRVQRYGCSICDYQTTTFIGFGFVDFFPYWLDVEGIYRNEEAARGQIPMTWHRKKMISIDNMN